MSNERHLAAILFTDIVGYTAMMQKHEATAVSIIKHYHEALEKSVAAHRGEILNNYGDGSLCSFRSALDALHCAVELQRNLQAEPAVPLRIGLHTGEIFFENGKVLGDAVNIASRIQSLGIANSILISSEIQSKLKNQPEFKTVSLGSFQFKNVDDLIEVFALANEGLAIPDKNKLEGKLQPPKRSKRLGWMVAGLLLLTLAGYFLFQKFNKPIEVADKSIAVLFFENFTNDPELEVFCEGLTDEILNHLAKVGSLSITSRTSVKMYKGTKLPLKEIARNLGVTHILEGSVRKSGNKVRITAQLIDAITDKHIWSEDYDYSELNDIFPVQTDVSTRVTEVLKLKLTRLEKESLSKKYTENIQAYKLYRRGRNFWDKRTKESYDSAEICYKRAIELDPDYALAYAGLADCYTFNLKGMTQVEAIPIAKAYLGKALALDSSLCEGWATAGFIKSHFDYDWEGSKSIFEKAIRLNPNYATAYLYYGNVFFSLGNTEIGIEKTKKALALDPLSSSINWVLGRNYYHASKFELALEQLQKTLTIDPNYFYAKEYIALTLLQNKIYGQALDIITSNIPQKNYGSTENGIALLAYAYALSGNFKKAKETIALCLADPKFNSPYWLAIAYISLKDFSKAMDQLEKGYDKRVIQMIHLKVNPAIDPIRQEPRFKALMKKINLN